MHFYAIFSKKQTDKFTDEFAQSKKSFILPLKGRQRHQAMDEATRIARQKRLTFEGVYPYKGQEDSGDVMSKHIQEQRARVHARQVQAFKQKLKKKS